MGVASRFACEPVKIAKMESAGIVVCPKDGRWLEIRKDRSLMIQHEELVSRVKWNP